MPLTKAEIFWLVKKITKENLGLDVAFSESSGPSGEKGVDSRDGEIEITVKKPRNGRQMILVRVATKNDERFVLQISADYILELVSIDIHKHLDNVVLSTLDLKEE